MVCSQFGEAHVINKKLSQFAFPKAGNLDDIRDVICHSQISDHSQDLETQLKEWEEDINPHEECMAEVE